MTDEALTFSDARSWAINLARLRLDLYRVIAAILASPDFQRPKYLHTLSDIRDALVGLAGDFESSEIEHGLVSVAAMTRVLLDQTSPRPAISHAHCGMLIVDLSDPDMEQPLTLREACNKILHATSRRFATDEEFGELIPFMHLSGSQQGRHWKADLHILPFASQVAELTEPDSTTKSNSAR